MEGLLCVERLQCALSVLKAHNHVEKLFPSIKKCASISHSTLKGNVLFTLVGKLISGAESEQTWSPPLGKLSWPVVLQSLWGYVSLQSCRFLFSS